MTEPTVRPARSDDAAEINRLHAHVNGVTRSREQWAWEYERGPWGPARIWLAVEGERCLGHWAWIPFGMCKGARRFPAYKSEGLMVHADARGRGIAGKLVAAALASDALEKGELIWTFPNAPALKILARAGYREVGRIDALLALRSPLAVALSRTPLRAAPCIAAVRALDRLWRRRTPAPAAGFSAEPVTLADERFDRLWERVAPDYGLTIERSARWLNWRFVDDPFIEYTLVTVRRDPSAIDGYAVLYDQLEGPLRFGYVSDWVVDGAVAGAADALLAQVLGHFARRRADVVLAYHIAGGGGPYPALAAGLRNAGPLVRRENKTFIVRDASATGAAARPLRDWCVSESFTEGVGA